MNVLRRAFESLGFSEVATFLGRGNVIFEASAKDLGMLGKRIERKLQQALGYGVPVFIRTPAEMRGIAVLSLSRSPRSGARTSMSSFSQKISIGGQKQSS
jgi:uncharacterized protein (DUF1697 family)